MARKKKRRASQNRVPCESKRKWTVWQKIKTFLPIGIILALISAVPDIASYTTRLGVDIATQIDPAKPFSFPATVNNGGTFPVELEEYIIGWSELKTSKGDVIKNFILVTSPHPAAKIYPGGKFDLVIPLDQLADVSPENRLTSPGATIVSCDLLIGVKCKTFKIFSQEQIFHFLAVIKPDGQIYWSPGASFTSGPVYKTLRSAHGNQ